MGLQNSEGLVSLDTRVGIPLGNKKKITNKLRLNEKECEVHTVLMRFIVTELLMGKLQIFHHALQLPSGGLLGGFLLLLLLVFLDHPNKPNSPYQQ